MVDQSMGSKGEIRSNFSRTCRLLSQYLKQTGSFGGLALHMPPCPPDQQAKGELLAPTTMSLLPGVDASETERSRERGCPPKSVDLFPSDVEQALNGQLTFFYGGRVVVFDDFPADKAEKLMRMASEESNIAGPNFTFSAPAAADCPPKLGNLAPPESPSRANAADMPIARRNSLHRFLEKRKDRISSAAPYQVELGAPATAAKEANPEPSTRSSWLNLGRQASNPGTSSPENSSK